MAQSTIYFRCGVKPLHDLRRLTGRFISTHSVLAASFRESTLVPSWTYDGGFSDATEVRLRVANGGAGQTGLIGAFADAFIQDQVKKGATPFKVRMAPF